MKFNLRQKTAYNAIIMVSQTLFGKVVTLLGQIVLARLLIPEVWGIYALALSAAGFASIIGQMGLIQALIQRQNLLDYWVRPAFLLSSVSGFLIASILASVAPFWATAMNESRLAPVILLLAVDVLLISLTVVPKAILHSRLNFGHIASVGAVGIIIQTGLSILLAYNDFGVYSFVIPKLIFSLFQLIMLWNLARPSIGFGFQADQFPPLLKDGGAVVLAGLAYTITQQGDYLILGALAGTESVGLYFLAFTLSTQITAMLTNNIQTILLPSLGKIDRVDGTQYRQVRRTMTFLAILIVPVCGALAVAAEPLIALLYGSQWGDAAPVLQALSLAAAFRVLAGPLAVLVQAKGRFQVFSLLHIVSAITFLTIVGVMTYFAGILGTAYGVLAHAALAVFIFSYQELREGRATIYSIISPIKMPIISTLLAVIAVSLVLHAFPGLEYCVRVSSLFELGIIGLVGGVVYGGGIYWLARSDVLDLLSLVGSVFKVKRGALVNNG